MNAMTELEWRSHVEQEKSRLDREHGVITQRSEIRGWDIMELSRHKPGVLRYIIQRDTTTGGREQRIGYAKDEVFDGISIAP